MSIQSGLKEKEKDQSDERRTEDVVKITISKEAEINLSQILERVNSEFDAGRVNRQELATWALIRFAQDCDVDTIRLIRQEHFDELAYLESILRRSKESGKLPPELKSALKAHLGMESQPKKSGKKPLTTNYINDVIGCNEGTGMAS